MPKWLLWKSAQKRISLHGSLRVTLPILLAFFILTSNNFALASVQTSNCLSAQSQVKALPVVLSQGNNGTLLISATKDYAAVNATAGYTFYENTAAVVESTSLGLDGTATGSARSATVTTNTLTTSSPYDIVYVVVAMRNAKVATITNTGTALTWTQRSTATSSQVTLETWYAKTATTYTGTVKATLSASTDAIVIAFGIRGANYTNPFDPNLTNAVTNSGTNTTPAVTLSTQNPNTLLIGAVSTWQNSETITAGSGFGLVTTPPTRSSLIAASEYNIANQTLDQTSINYTLSTSASWTIIGDAIQGISAARNTGFEVPSGTGSAALTVGTHIHLYSPTFPTDTTLYSGSWIVDLWASATASGTLGVSLLIVDSSNMIISTIAGGNTKTITTTKTEVSTPFSGSQITIPAGGRIIANISNPATSGKTFTVYWGVNQATNFQTPTTYNYIVAITNTAATAYTMKLSTFSTANLGRISNLTLTLSSPATQQITITNGVLSQASGSTLTLSPGVTKYLQVYATANSLGSSNIAISISFTTNNKPFTNEFVNLSIN